MADSRHPTQKVIRNAPTPMVGLTPPNHVCTPSAGCGNGGISSDQNNNNKGIHTDLEQLSTPDNTNAEKGAGFTSKTTGIVIVAIVFGAVLYFSML